MEDILVKSISSGQRRSCKEYVPPGPNLTQKYQPEAQGRGSKHPPRSRFGLLSCDIQSSSPRNSSRNRRKTRNLAWYTAFGVRPTSRATSAAGRSSTTICQNACQVAG